MRVSDFAFAGGGRASGIDGRLRELGSFAPNPGNLRGHVFIPASSAIDIPLVVVLHGCTQTAVSYASGAGWLELAAREGFAVLLPEQQRANNPNLCFNWFEPRDMKRGEGEPASIAAMIAQVVRDHAIDPARVFITGLSAGGAMAGVMLATYPEVFAGGGLIAGLPYGVSGSVPAAMLHMRKAADLDATAFGELVSGASDHPGPWPRISVWHGGSDSTVHVSNAAATAAQWADVHGVGDRQPHLGKQTGASRKTWHDASGRALLELVEIPAMGHGTPIAAKDPDGIGQAGPFILDVGISSSEHLADFWGLIDSAQTRETTARSATALANRATPHLERLGSAPPRHETGVEKIINDALRAAGLLK